MNFQSGELFHIYNKGQEGTKLFYTEENYHYFLQKLKTELTPFCDILAYCLMPNHYHVLIRIKEGKDFEFSSTLYTQDQKSQPLSRKIGSLQSSYTQAINKQFGLKGSLFSQGAKIKILKNHADICFYYLHQSPVKAKLCDKLEDWSFTSFRDYYGLRNDNFISRDLAYRLLNIPKDRIKFHNQSMAVIRDGVLENIF